MGLAACPLSRLTATAPPRGEPSMCATKSLRKAKSRLPLWGRWTRVSEDGEGKLPAAPSHGLCGSAGELPSQSPNGDSSPEGRAKSRLPPWGRCPPVGGGEGNLPAARTIPCPPAAAYTKGRYTLGAVGQESSEETSVASKMPSRVSAAASVGAERCPPGTSAPRRGSST